MVISGSGGQFRPGQMNLQAGLSGTAARFLIALGLLRRDVTVIDGLPPLQARPNKHLVDAATDLGASVHSTNDGHLPVSIRGPEVFKSSIRVQGHHSSQYLSALLLVGPLLPNGLEVEIDGELVSRPYIDVTLREMLRFGVTVERDGICALPCAAPGISASHCSRRRRCLCRFLPRGARHHPRRESDVQ